MTRRRTVVEAGSAIAGGGTGSSSLNRKGSRCGREGWPAPLSGCTSEFGMQVDARCSSGGLSNVQVLDEATAGSLMLYGDAGMLEESDVTVFMGGESEAEVG